METLRCPTCLSVLLDGGQKTRCASCGKKLVKRGRPIVLGESNRIAARPVLPIEHELHNRVVAENAASERRRAATHRPKAPKKAPEQQPPPPRVRHARELRGGPPAAPPLIDDVFTHFEPTALVEIEPEVIGVREPQPQIMFMPETVEAVPVDPEIADRAPRTRGVEPESKPEPVARDVVIPEVLPGESQNESTVARRQAPVRQNMFSARRGSPRVKKMTKGRRGWVVDYVMPESEPKSEAETGT